MMYTKSRNVVLCLVLAAAAPIFAEDPAASVNPGFDFSGVEQFWKVVDILKKDQEPAVSQWDALFHTPGYRALIEVDFGDVNYLKRTMRAVFMPSKRDTEKELTVAKNKKESGLARYASFLINAYRNADLMRDQIAARVVDLKTYPYMKYAMAQASRFLPLKGEPAPPRMAFVVHPESRNYVPIVIGLWGRPDFSVAQKSGLAERNRTEKWPYTLFLAREIFVQLRRSTLKIRFPDMNDRDYPVVWLLDEIAGAGVAGQIDIKQLYFNDGPFSNEPQARALIAEQLKQPDVIRALDTFLSQAKDSSMDMGKLAVTARTIVPRGGRPTGFFMANTIIDQFQEKALTDVATDPIAFFLLYNKAAVNVILAPTLSADTIKYLKKLQTKYGH